MESIIRRAQMGDTAAFQQLVETYHAVAWRTARVLQPDTGLNVSPSYLQAAPGSST